MTWTSGDPPDWLVRLNSHADAVGGAEYLIPLDRDQLLAGAQASTGLDDFGGDTWRPHFDVLIDALVTEGRLTVAGRIVARTELLRSLRQRLLLTAAWTADPTILEEPIDAPVFVVGTARSGTSILHELLALDPASRVPLTWELLHPGEALSDADVARRAGHEVHSFWADLQPAYATMHHNHGDEPNECIFATMLEFLSDQWSGTYDIPTYSGHLIGADHTEAYRYHRKVLQTLQRRRRGDRWVLKAPSHLAQLRTLVLRLSRRACRPDPPRSAQDGSVDDQPHGHPQVDALGRRRRHRPRSPRVDGLRLHARRHDRRPGQRRAARHPVRRRAIPRLDRRAGRHLASYLRRPRPPLAVSRSPAPSPST